MLSSNGRKSRIRAPKKNLVNEVDFKTSWSVLSSAISEIQNKNASNLSFEELYRKSYNLVLRKHGKELYDSVQDLVRDHLVVIQQKLKDEQDVLLLSDVSSLWKDHLLAMRMISDVLMYLDRVYAKEFHLPLIYDAGINSFRDNVIKRDDFTIGLRLNQLTMEQITKNRNGLIIDIFLIKSIITMFESLIEDHDGETYYSNKFEPFYLNKTLEYYEKLSLEIFEMANGSIYLKKIDELIINEQDKCVLYLPPTTITKVIDLINKTLIVSKIDKVLKFQNSGFKIWIQQNKIEDLSLLYKLLKKVDYFDGMKEQLKEIIIEDGIKIDQENEINKSKKPTLQAIQTIEKLIELKTKYDSILQIFQKDIHIEKAIDNSFIEVINKNIKIAEFLSLFIDDSIKKSSTKTEEEIEESINKSIIIFRYLKDKDLFEKYYKNHLAKRLLKTSSKNFEIERNIILKFKNEIGSNFTSKLEGMFRDINLSKDISQRFDQKDFEINVLTKTFWPIQPSTQSEVILPNQLFNIQRKFNDFYSKFHNGRYLTWSYNIGSIDIRIKFNKKVHELNMSLYCGIIVLLFEECEELTYKDIQTLTKIPEVDLIRSLQSIAVAPKTRILTKIPMSKDINPDDLFKFNYDFTSPMTKIKVLTVINKLETDKERSKTMEILEEDRKFELDAAIVRIMKSRKTVNHNELIIELIKQLNNRFKPSPQFIKKRINNLLDKEYLKRDDEDRSVYHYLA